jgi:hypothetical protein
MMKFTIPHIAFGRLVKPLSASFDVRRMRAGRAPRIWFDSTGCFSGRVRPRSRSLMEGLFDGAASFNASRYRCH